MSLRDGRVNEARRVLGHPLVEPGIWHRRHPRPVACSRQQLLEDMFRLRMEIEEGETEALEEAKTLRASAGSRWSSSSLAGR